VQGVIDILQPIGNLKVSLAYVINALIGYTVVVLGLVFVALHFKLRFLVGRPILQLVNVMREITDQRNLNSRVRSGKWIAELRLLSEYFNRLLDTLGNREDALRESEARFRHLTELSSDYYWESDAEHRLTVRSESSREEAEGMIRQSSLIGKRRWDIPYLSPDEAGWQAHRAELDSHLPFRNFEIARLRANGAVQHVAISGEPVFDSSGVFKGYRGVGADITERKQAEQALHESAEKLRLFADNVPAMTISFDYDLRCLFANKHYADFFGFDTVEILGKHVREIVGEVAYAEIEGHFVQVLQGHPVTYQRTRTLANGEARYLEVKALPQIGQQGKVLGCFVVTTDITEHKLSEERIQHVAHHDNLTGLANRMLFNDRLKQAITLAKRNSSQIALLYLDLDKFKPVNDTFGHSVGDELLKGVGERLQRQVREYDTVARLGGDEFAVILPDLSRREYAETVARRIAAALSAPFQLGSQVQSLEIGTSIGIAVYPVDAKDMEALIKAADEDMYLAKQKRRGMHDSTMA
jgi:diguanylate cyclase (GGDEF)-like protein/PAS domain S-box-containing protein